jgi:16S rRNA pseudouridine516 synthase
MRDSLATTLFSQGFGTRKECELLIKNRRARSEGEALFVDDVQWPLHEKAYVLLNKPVGYECSHAPANWPSVYALLPEPLRNRPVKGGQNGVQAVGRLDQDTTGMLLLSDDGQFIHKMNSPKHHVPKVYRVTCAEPITAQQVQTLLTGVALNDSPKPVCAAGCTQTSENELSLTLTEGKYHQVKRMIAAVGNHVEALHRAQIGQLALPEDLAPSHWRWLTPEELGLLAKA